MARDADGNRVDVVHKDACKWCLVGAIYLAYPLHEATKVMNKVEYALVEHPVYKSVFQFNDNVTHDELIKLVQELGI